MSVPKGSCVEIQVCDYTLISTKQAVSQEITMLIEMRACKDDSQLDRITVKC